MVWRRESRRRSVCRGDPTEPDHPVRVSTARGELLVGLLYPASGYRRGDGCAGWAAREEESQGDEPRAPGDVADDVGEAGCIDTERYDDAGGDQRGRRVAGEGHPARGAAGGGGERDEDGEGRGEGVADGLADDGAEPGVEQLEGEVRVGGSRWHGRVVADSGDELHPSRQA